MRKTGRVGLVRWAGLAVLVCALGAWAQPTVPVTVQIEDRVGGIVANAPVDIYAEHGGPFIQLPNGGEKILPVVSGLTDSQGDLRFALNPGNYSVHVRAGSTGTMFAVLHLADGPTGRVVLQTVPVDTPVEVDVDADNVLQTDRATVTALIQSQAAPTPVPNYTPVTVQVTDASGAVVPGAEIRVTPGSPAGDRLITDERGQAQLGVPAGKYQVQVTAQGFATATQALEVADKPQTLTVALVVEQQPVSRVSGEAVPMQPGAVPLESTVETPHAASEQPAVVLTVIGAEGLRGVFTPATLLEYPQQTVTVFDPHEKRQETYGGVPLMDLLAKLGVMRGKTLMGKALAQYVVATGSDGYKSVVALGEVDPEFHPGTVLVADTMDGKPLDAKAGPFRLVVSEDKRPARSVRNLVRVEVRTAE